MTNSKENNNKTWQNLDWEKKVQICQKGISHEDTLLITYVVIFIGLEALFLTAVFSGNLGRCPNIVIAALGILVAVHFIRIFKRAADVVDRWGAILYVLWAVLNKREKYISGIKTSEFMELHKPSIERRKRLKKGKIKGWLKVVFGWTSMSRSELKRRLTNENRKRQRIKLYIKFARSYLPALESRRRMMTTWTPILVIVAWVLVLIFRICPCS